MEERKEPCAKRRVTRRRFIIGAAATGAAVVGTAGAGAVGQSTLARTGETAQAPQNGEALRELLLRAQEGPSGRRFPVLDIHAHASLKPYMLRQRFWRTHAPKPGMSPVTQVTDIDALVNGGAGAFVCCAYAPEQQFYSDLLPLTVLSKAHPKAYHMANAPMNALAVEHLDTAEAMVEETNRRRGDIIKLAARYPDIGQIVDEGKICMLHAMEGAHHLGGRMELVDEFFQRGVCMMTVPHLYPNEAGGCVELLSKFREFWWGRGSFSGKYQDSSGLSPWGHELVERLLDVGIIVCIRHGTLEYRAQVFDIVKRHPKKRAITMSHAIIETDPLSAERGPTPGDVRAIADSGGTVGLMMTRHGYGSPGNAMEGLLNAVEYLIRHGSEDVVAIGTDFDGLHPTPMGLESPRRFGDIRNALLAEYTEDQTAKFLYGNADRMLRIGWGKA